MKAQALRTTSRNADFQSMVKSLDQYLAICDGEDHAFYDQFNQIQAIQHVVVLYIEENVAVACGAFKKFSAYTAEIKRMFTREKDRGNGYAVLVLNELETWARELGYTRCVLETGINQHAALQFYPACGYLRIANFPPYKNVTSSFCYEKRL